jgi:hypothetical protein
MLKTHHGYVIILLVPCSLRFFLMNYNFAVFFPSFGIEEKTFSPWRTDTHPLLIVQRYEFSNIH